jgi:hypothetical protein
MLWGSQHAGAGAAALRGLRRWVAGISTRNRQDDWANRTATYLSSARYALLVELTLE